MKLFLIELFSSLAFKFAETPRAWGVVHILYIAIGLSAAFVFSFFSRKASEERFNRILRTAGFILAGMEVFKISFFLFAVNGGDAVATAGLFPFQLCSLPIYMAPLASFLKKESPVRKALLTFMMTYTLMSGFSTFIETSGILQEYVLATLHSLIWHAMLVFIGLLIAFSGRGGHTFRDFFRGFICFIVCCNTALFLNVLIETLLPGAEVNMFYIGPRRSSLVIFNTIFDRYGWVVQMRIYEIALSIGACAVFQLTRLGARPKKAER